MKKKILFINPSLRQGGVEHSLITALKILDPEKYEITLFLYTDMTDLLSEVPDYVKVVLQPDRTRYFRKPFCIWKMTQYKLYKALGREEKAEEARKSMYAYIHRRKVAYGCLPMCGLTWWFRILCTSVPKWGQKSALAAGTC